MFEEEILQSSKNHTAEDENLVSAPEEPWKAMHWVGSHQWKWYVTTTEGSWCSAFYNKEALLSLIEVTLEPILKICT